MVEQKLQQIKHKSEEGESQSIMKNISINWESEIKYQKCQFFLTGFGKFGQHLVNPTTHLMEHVLCSSDKFNQKPYVLADYRVLEVTTKACLKYYDDIICIMNKQNEENKTKTLNIVIHFGLYSGCGSFRLENFGKNCADFSIPDMAGVQLKKEKICKDYPLQHFLKTTLPIEYLTEKMQKHFPKQVVDQSTSAGSYICNYIYYVSLFHSQIENFHSLFVHFIQVPEFTEIQESVQQQFLEKLLDEIYAFYSEHIEKVKD